MICYRQEAWPQLRAGKAAGDGSGRCALPKPGDTSHCRTVPALGEDLEMPNDMQMSL